MKVEDRFNKALPKLKRESDPFRWRADFYHRLLKTPWLVLVVYIAAVYLGINVVFALIYHLGPAGSLGGAERSLPDCFFFSVQTLSTIGYGAVAPQSMYANVAVTVEAIIGVIGTAIATGIMFAKFSRPLAFVLFSDVAVIRTRDGVPTLCFRMANGRGTEVVDASLDVTVLLRTETKEGERMRRFFPLKLERDRSPFFLLTWTAMHPIDEDSPLFGLDKAALDDGDVVILATLNGIDGLSGQQVYGRQAYSAEDVRFDHAFVDILHSDERGTRIDFAGFHETISASKS